MKNINSCEKLIGIEAGLPWPEQTKDLPIVAALRREKTVTRCMNLLYAFLTISVLLLVFFYFWYPITRPTSTSITIENVEIEKAELLVPMDSNDVASGTNEVTVDDTKTKISSPDPSVHLREQEIKDWIEDDSHPKSIAIFDDDVGEVIPKLVEKTNDASHEENNLPQKWESSSDSDESIKNSLPSSDESSEAKDNESSEKLDAYDDRSSEVSNSGEAQTTTESDSYVDGLPPFPTTSEDSLKGQGSSDKGEKVIEIEKKNNDEETQKSKNSEEKTNYDQMEYDYESYYNNYDNGLLEENYEYSESSSEELPTSVEKLEGAPTMNELDVKVPIISSSTPTTVGLTIRESDKLLSDSTSTTDQDTNEPDVAEKIVDESSTQDYAPRPVDDSIDKSSDEWEPYMMSDSNEYDYGKHGIFSDEDYSSYSGWKEEIDEGLRMRFEDPQPIYNEYWQPINIAVFPDGKLSFERTIDEQNKEKTTEDGTIREAETTMQSVLAEEMVTIDVGKDDTASTLSPVQYPSEDALSEESDTVESRLIENDTEDSQQVNEDTVNLEPTSKSVEDYDSLPKRWINPAVLPYYCDILKDLFPEDVDSESDVLLGFPEGGELEDQINQIYRELWMNRCLLSKGKYLDEFRRHLISERSVRERVSDSPSVSKAGQILTAMQQVIQQDKNYIHDAVSRIHGSMTPIVESQVNEFFEKMEAVSSHIDRLHEQYLKKNKLEDDYVSREFPSEP